MVFKIMILKKIFLFMFSIAIFFIIFLFYFNKNYFSQSPEIVVSFSLDLPKNEKKYEKELIGLVNSHFIFDLKSKQLTNNIHSDDLKFRVKKDNFITENINNYLNLELNNLIYNNDEKIQFLKSEINANKNVIENIIDFIFLLENTKSNHKKLFLLNKNNIKNFNQIFDQCDGKEYNNFLFTDKKYLDICLNVYKSNLIFLNELLDKKRNAYVKSKGYFNYLTNIKIIDQNDFKKSMFRSLIASIILSLILSISIFTISNFYKKS